MDREKLTNFHRQNILEAADRLFLAHGFDGTTVDMISAESKYSKPTLYAYFKSKDEIYVCNLCRRLEALLDCVKRAVAEESLFTAYLNSCRVIADFYAEYPVYFQGVIGSVRFEPNGKSAEESGSVAELGGKINGSLCTLIARAAETGLFRPGIDPEFAYVHIWSCVVGLITSEKLKRSYGKEEYGRVLDRSFLAVLHGVFHGE